MPLTPVCVRVGVRVVLLHQVADWELRHRGYVEEEMLAMQTMRWAEHGVALAESTISSMEHYLDRVKHEVVDLDKKQGAAATLVDALRDSIDIAQ